MPGVRNTTYTDTIQLPMKPSGYLQGNLSMASTFSPTLSWATSPTQTCQTSPCSPSSATMHPKYGPHQESARLTQATRSGPRKVSGRSSKFWLAKPSSETFLSLLYVTIHGATTTPNNVLGSQISGRMLAYTFRAPRTSCPPFGRGPHVYLQRCPRLSQQANVHWVPIPLSSSTPPPSHRYSLQSTLVAT